MKRWLIAFVIAWVVLVVLGSVTNTQFVLASLSELGVEIPFGTRLTTTGQDILNMAPIYGVVFGGAFLGAMLAATAVAGFVTLPREIIFAIAGVIAIVMTLWVMQIPFGVTILASARSGFGAFMQCAVGGIAGLLFARAAFAPAEDA